MRILDTPLPPRDYYPAQRYDWQAIFCGKVVELVRHVDFPGDTETFRMNLYSKARELGFKVQTRVRDSNTILVQATRYLEDIDDYDPRETVRPRDIQADVHE